MKYSNLLQKFQADPDFLVQFRNEANDRQRIYAKSEEYRAKRAKANADYKFRKARGQPTRPRTLIKGSLPLAVPLALPVTFTVSFH